MPGIEKDNKTIIRFDVSPIRTFEITCKVLDVDEDRVSLAYPEDKMEFANYLYEGKELGVVIYTDKGLHAFDSVVLDSPLESEFIIELPEERNKIQRREYVRMPVKLSLTLNKGDEVVETEIINIGGGGVRFKSNTTFSTNERWGFSFYIPEHDEPLTGSGAILYNLKQDNYIVSVIKFVHISESDRNRIIKLCFDEEVNRIKMRTRMINEL